MSAKSSLGDALLNPRRLWTRAEVLTHAPVPAVPGVYAWYFRRVPPGVPTEGCHVRHGAILLYVGISPKAPPKNGKPPSRENLRTRIRFHFTGKAEGSTLRLTLGCLLSDELGIGLHRVGSGRLTFAEGEARLNEWMQENALVAWVTTDKPWELEDHLVSTLCLPLNIKGNRQHPFCSTLRACRAAAKRTARTA